MADEHQNAGATPDPAGESQETPMRPAGDAGKQSATPKLEDLQAELARAQAALKSANAESASRRKKLDEYETREKKAKEAELSEAEKLKAQLAEAQTASEQMKQELASIRLRHAVEREAQKLGFKNPDDAYLLADMTGVEMDDGGTIKGVKEALDKLLKDRPYLGNVAESPKTPPPDISARSAGKGANPMEGRTEELLRRFPTIKMRGKNG